jgi:hypothetical protein
MKWIIILIDFLIIGSLYVNGQEDCNRKSKKFEKSPYNSDNKLTTDRFYHTISPDITKCKDFQLETVLVLRDEFYTNDTLKSTTDNAYSSYKIRYALLEGFEISLSLNDIIIRSGEEIKEYGGQNPYSRVTFSTKYRIYESENRKNILGFSGLIALPKFQQVGKSKFSYEAKLLYSNKPIKYLKFTGNFGVASIDKENKMFTYAIEMKSFISGRLELLSEYYRNYSNLGYTAYPQNRILLGIGYYVTEKAYIYSSFENGFNKDSSLNRGRIDVGLTCRF